MAEPDNTPPEMNWTFRRIYVYSNSIVTYILLTIIILMAGIKGAHMWIALALILQNIVTITLYIAGASFEWTQMVKINVNKDL